MATLTGKTAKLKNLMEIEMNKKKRDWLAAFSCPELLGRDVTGLGDEEMVDHVSGEYTSFPTAGCFINIFGYSCKDLSTLNNHNSEYKDDCLATDLGSSGATWRGKLPWVRRVRPPILLVENVRADLKGKNLQQTG